VTEPRPLPRVVASPLDGTRSVAVELCTFRLCDWTSPDTRSASREVVDDLVREHLLDAHRRELTALGQVAREAGLIR
jgi:hypothetical protein